MSCYDSYIRICFRKIEINLRNRRSKIVDIYVVGNDIKSSGRMLKFISACNGFHLVNSFRTYFWPLCKTF